jgi:hypothetical protein
MFVYQRVTHHEFPLLNLQGFGEISGDTSPTHAGTAAGDVAKL